ncbi:MAG: alpha/beta fold hydrolase [Rhodospirillales bacterium]|nr:alpha/beta fold hydrolase [Rhodospirillales bacterium]MCB9996883.1 alpha/beta fold hydrolase [Rhodospirillales bacterium]
MIYAPPAHAQDHAPDRVVLLHGIAKSAHSMKPLEDALQAQGYKTIAITYPSTDYNLDGLAAVLRDQYLTEAFWQGPGKVHFITHSMGGLVARRYLDRFKAALPPEKIGRVVMLAPPNGGSEVADTLHGLPPYDWYYGPAGDELTTAAQAANKSDIYYDLGIIAGTKEWPYIVAAFVIPGPGDGRVSVENTKLAGMKDHITVNGTHTFIMDKPVVHKQVLSFLQNGMFAHEE